MSRSKRIGASAAVADCDDASASQRARSARRGTRRRDGGQDPAGRDPADRDPAGRSPQGRARIGGSPETMLRVADPPERWIADRRNRDPCPVSGRSIGGGRDGGGGMSPPRTVRDPFNRSILTRSRPPGKPARGRVRGAKRLPEGRGRGRSGSGCGATQARAGRPTSASTSSAAIGTWAQRSTGPDGVTRMSFSSRTPIPSSGM